jgi:hypothetical protein
MVAAFGILFGFIGLMGLYDDNNSFVRMFLYFIMAHLLVYTIGFAFDFHLLNTKCVGRVPGAQGYNPPLDLVSQKGLCIWTRNSYTLGFLVGFFLHLYFISVTKEYVTKCAQKLPHLIQFNPNENDHLSIQCTTGEEENPGDYLVLRCSLYARSRFFRDDSLVPRKNSV